MEKVEKVVKPPQNPVINSNGSHDGIFGCRTIIPHNKPMNKQPTMLTVNVAQGNPLPVECIKSETMYLTNPPKKLPAPTMRISFIIKYIVVGLFVNLYLFRLIGLP